MAEANANMAQSPAALKPEAKKRITVVDSSVSIKINVGNFETIDVSKSAKIEIEFSTPDELVQKSAKFDAHLIKMVKALAEETLKETGRSRRTKENEVETWGNAA